MKLRRCASHAVFYANRMALPSLHPEEETGYNRLKRWMDYRIRHRQAPTADDFGISMREAFALAQKQVPSVVVRRGLVGGNPCVKGTRIPIYMILDGVEYYGSLKGVLKSYPRLTVEQVKQAVRFAKISMECYIEP